jgi:hypothetical protein
MNGDIYISPFSKIRMTTFVHFNHPFGTTITHDDVKNAQSDKYQWQQRIMASQIPTDYHFDLISIRGREGYGEQGRTVQISIFNVLSQE